MLAEVRMMRRTLCKSTAALWLLPWMVVSLAVGVLAAAPSSAASSAQNVGHRPLGSSVKLVSVTLHDDGGSPISVANLNFEIQENGSVTEYDSSNGFGPLINDSTDSDSDATWNPVAAGVPATDGTATVNPDGTFSYIPNAGFSGSDSFGYTLSDSDGNEASGVVTIEVVVPVKTTTTFTDTGTPAAASPSNPVTFSVKISNGGAGPTPTGNVTFAWTKTNGVPNTITGTIAVVPLNASGNASVTSTLPIGGQGGDMSITATYTGDTSNNPSAASTVYYVLKTCYEGAWPGNTKGQTVPLANTSAEGYYIGQSNGWFTVYVVNHPATTTDFTGSVTTNGLLLDTNTIKFSRGDRVSLKIGKTYSKTNFSLHDHGFVSGFSFYTGCGQYLAFDLEINGSPAKKKQIFLGSSDTNPTSVPMDITRKLT
jgi:Bacterial Ig domain